MPKKHLPEIELESVLKKPNRKFREWQSKGSAKDIPEVVVVAPNSRRKRPVPVISNIPRKISRWPSVNELSTHDPHSFYVQLNELDKSGLFWRERARWIKYEENVEPSGNWGRPFLSYIEAESLRSFIRSLVKGLVLLGSVNDGAYNMSHIVSSMLVLGGLAEPKHRARIQQILCLPRMHQGESTARLRRKVLLRREFLKTAAQKRRNMMAHAWELTGKDEVRDRWVRLVRKALDQHRKQTGKKVIWENLLVEDGFHVGDIFHESDQPDTGFAQLHPISHNHHSKMHHAPDEQSSISDNSHCSFLDFNEDDPDFHGLPTTKEQIKLRKIIHCNCEGILILHASVNFLKRDNFLSAFLRFKNLKPIADSMEISIPIRFVYILITSKHTINMDGYEVCRAAATLFKDKTFLRYAMRAKSVNDLTDAANKFIDGSIMLPPGNWKSELLIPVAEAISERSRKKQLMRKFKHRDGKDLWRIVRAKLFVIVRMKGLVQSNGSSKGHKTSDKGVNDENSNGFHLFPRRGDCPVRTRFCRIGHHEIANSEQEELIKQHVESTSADSNDDDDDDDEESATESHPLHADGKWFGGLKREIESRYPLYWSDIKDGLNIQCLASLCYLAISLTAMCLTYGQVIAKYTKNNLGPSEMLSATSVSCILMALFGTEPLSVIAGTAAMLIFESSSYQISDELELDFFQFRFLTGIWIFIFLVLILAFDKTHWIHYCTRFTEEILHVLVALLFMYEGIKNLVKIFEKHPLRKEYILEVGNFSNKSRMKAMDQKPNTALLYMIFMFTTVGIALGFRLFEKTRFFSPRIRRLLNFFSIPMAINVMNVITYFLSVYLNTMSIPEGFQATSPDKNRFIILDFQKISAGILSYWIIPLAAIPALLTVILLFIESEVTLLECFKQTRGKKGSGFHVNLLIVAIMVLVSSFLGFPWMCLAAVETSVHLDSLKVWSCFDAPGVKSHVIKIREQRLTLLFTGILVGLAFFLNSYLNHIPEAVFSGMVLYMGIVALFGVQMVERFFLMFMAPGQHPDIPYLKNVPLHKIYLFTIIQIACVVVLWIVKNFKIISPIFPLVVLLMIPLRALLGKVFSEKEMDQLDNEDEEGGHGPLD